MKIPPTFPLGCLLGYVLFGMVAAADDVSGVERYHYDIRWQSLTAGKARVTITATNEHHLVCAEARTENLAQRLLAASYRGLARVTPDMRARDVMEDRTIRGRRVATYTRFQPDGMVDIRQGKVKPRHYVRLQELRLEEGAEAIDAFTVVLRMRAFPWDKGRVFESVLLIGDELYNLELTCRRATRIKIDGEKHSVWELRPRLQLFVAPGNAMRDDIEDREDTIRAVDKARIYLSRDEEQRVMSIETRTKVGRFNVVLTGQ